MAEKELRRPTLRFYNRSSARTMRTGYATYLTQYPEQEGYKGMTLEQNVMVEIAFGMYSDAGGMTMTTMSIDHNWEVALNLSPDELRYLAAVLVQQVNQLPQ